jgi:hypothetical protein
MSIANGVWHDAVMDPPEDGERVLVVKCLRSGERTIDFGRHYDEYGWMTNSGSQPVVLWMPLPKIPEVHKDA